jgi:FtsP/CotA-like multicopper oxidase with cupredoxin domain
MQAGAREFWRVVNASADTIMDLQVVYDGVAQPIEIADRDGVPTGSHDGHSQGTLIKQKHVVIPPAGREEFIITGPSAQVAKAQLITRHVDTGPLGDSDVARPLAAIQLTQDASKIPSSVERSAHHVSGTRFDGLTDAMVTAHRKLYFSEDPTGVDTYFITVDGQKPKAYDPDDPPAIVTTQGAVEDWTIENRTGEIHAFHIHQIHFKQLEENGGPGDQQFWDTYPIDYWKGSGPYPYIKVRMDFRGAVVGEFVYHCHILDHEDGGMMANMRVLPKIPPPATGK